MKVLGNVLDLDLQALNLYGCIPKNINRFRGESVKITTNSGVIMYGNLSGLVIPEDSALVKKRPKSGTIITLDNVLIIKNDKPSYCKRAFIGVAALNNAEIQRIALFDTEEALYIWEKGFEYLNARNKTAYMYFMGSSRELLYKENPLHPADVDYYNVNVRISDTETKISVLSIAAFIHLLGFAKTKTTTNSTSNGCATEVYSV